MDFYQFRNVYAEIKAEGPLWLSQEQEPLATSEQISQVESKLGVRLPTQYKEFVSGIGSGYFGRVNIFSVNENSEWYLPARLASSHTPKNFLPISDDECGGYYGFEIADGSCSPNVFYVYPDEGDHLQLQFSCFFEYVVGVALSR